VSAVPGVTIAGVLPQSPGGYGHQGLGRLGHKRLEPAAACVHWHRGAFWLPDGATRPAAACSFAGRSVRIGTRADGLQAHVEADADPSGR
jgi:hypothetical protein